MFSYIYCFLEGVLLLPSVAILSILDQLVQYLVRFRELQWVFSVDFIGLRISFLAHFWPSSRSFICLSECIDCPHMIVPYSNFDRIKDLYICTARSKRMLGSELTGYMLVCFFCYVFYMRSERKFFIYDDSQYSLRREFSKAVSINGNWYLHSWSFVLFIIEHHIISFHWVNRNAPFWTPVLEVHYCNLNVYQ